MSLNIYIPYSLERDIFKGEELKFAIRSIEKYLSGWEDIILIGTPPGWFTGTVIEANDIPNKKEESIYRKMLIAAQIEKDRLFVMWHDDHFLLKKLKCLEIYYWHDGPLKEYKNGSARYQTTVNNTLAVYPDALNFDVHAPIVLAPKVVRDLDIMKDGEMCFKTSYCEFMGLMGPQMEDLKLNHWLPKEEIKTLIEGRLFFSTGTLFSIETGKESVLELLKELYPKKSKFERV